jgi:hypothetical protein
VIELDAEPDAQMMGVRLAPLERQKTSGDQTRRKRRIRPSATRPDPNKLREIGSGTPWKIVVVLSANVI